MANYTSATVLEMSEPTPRSDLVIAATKSMYGFVPEALAEFARCLERDLNKVTAIANEIGRLATCMDAIPPGAIGTQKALLEELTKKNTKT